MRRLARILFNAASVASVPLLLLTAALWVRTCLRTDQVQTSGRRLVIFTSSHRLWFVMASRPYWTGIPYQSREVDDGFAQQFGRFYQFRTSPAPEGKSYAFLGFVWLSYGQPLPAPPCRFTYVGVPLWFPLIASMMLPALWLRRACRGHGPGLCRTCGYDLRATPERCPECGTIPIKGP